MASNQSQTLTPLEQQLETILANHGGAKEGYSSQVPELVVELARLAVLPGVTTICETGFHGGHSSLRFLETNPAASVRSFDLGRYAYSIEAATFLSQQFPGRLEVVWGDSTVMVPQHLTTNPAAPKCDLVFVDGGHTIEVGRADLLNMQQMAKPGATVVMDDVCSSSSFCTGPRAAWNELLASGQVLQTLAVDNSYRGFSVGTYYAPPVAR